MEPIETRLPPLPPPPPPQTSTKTNVAVLGLVQVPEDVNVWTLAPAGAELAQVVPLLDKTLPLVPGATNCTALVPLPRITLLAVNVAAPVPPAATGSVPAVSAEADVE
jgi:hypothetical protein